MEISEKRINYALFWLITVSAVVRIFLAAFCEFGNDEVYYWTYAMYPDWSHFDHPPMIGLMIQLFSFDLFFSSELALRMSSVIFMTINTYLIFLIGKEIKNTLTGFYAALLYTASIYAFVITGIFILPDTPLSIFMFASVLMFLRYFKVEKPKQYFLILGGLFAGLAMLSKYSGVFLWVGVGLYILCYRRNELKNPYLYISAIISAICMIPVLMWNINNDFISFTFHGDRVSLIAKLHPIYFIYELLGEFLYNNPVNFVLIVVALIGLAKGNNYLDKVPKRFMLLLCLPFIGVFWYFSLTRPILPHWTAPAVTFLLLFPASYLADKYPIKDKSIKIPKTITASMAVLIFTILVGVVEIKTGFIPLNFSEESKTIQQFGSDDITLDMYGWRQLKSEFQRVRIEKIQEGMMKESDAMLGLKWFPMANMDYYVAYPLGINMLGFRDASEIHKYAWINEDRGGLHFGNDYWYMTESSDYYDAERYFGEWFNEIIPADTITITRCGQPAKYVFVYMLKDLQKIPYVTINQTEK